MTGSQTISTAARELSADYAAALAAEGDTHRDATDAFQNANIQIGRDRERAEIIAYIRLAYGGMADWLVQKLERGEHRP